MKFFFVVSCLALVPSSALAQVAGENPFGEPIEPKKSISGAAADGASGYITENLSAEDRFTIDAYTEFLETGILPNRIREDFLNSLVVRYGEGDLDSQPDLKAVVAEMIATRAIACLLDEAQNYCAEQ